MEVSYDKRNGERIYAEPVAGCTLEFPSSRYPKTGVHIRDAIASGHSVLWTIDKDGAEEKRKESLKGYPTKKDMTVTDGQWQCVLKVVQVLISDT
ncbi:Sporulation-specific extracellular nuclease precursor [compost metagenome]